MQSPDPQWPKVLARIKSHAKFSQDDCACMHAQLCLTLCYPMDCSLPGSSVHGISQLRILEWITMPSPRGSSWPRNPSLLHLLHCRQMLYCWASVKAQRWPKDFKFHEKWTSSHLVWILALPVPRWITWVIIPFFYPLDSSCFQWS